MERDLGGDMPRPVPFAMLLIRCREITGPSPHFGSAAGNLGQSSKTSVLPNRGMNPADARTCSTLCSRREMDIGTP